MVISSTKVIVQEYKLAACLRYLYLCVRGFKEFHDIIQKSTEENLNRQDRCSPPGEKFLILTPPTHKGRAHIKLQYFLPPNSKVRAVRANKIIVNQVTIRGKLFTVDLKRGTGK